MYIISVELDKKSRVFTHQGAFSDVVGELLPPTQFKENEETHYLILFGSSSASFNFGFMEMK